MTAEKLSPAARLMLQEIGEEGPSCRTDNLTAYRQSHYRGGQVLRHLIKLGLATADTDAEIGEEFGVVGGDQYVEVELTDKGRAYLKEGS